MNDERRLRDTLKQLSRTELKDSIIELAGEVERLRNANERLDALVNQPHTLRFLEAVRCEVAHQVERWGTAHDRAKEPQDWFWLIGYLAGKALAAHAKGDTEKALHHTISSAAALANWHAAISLADNRMSPGSSDLQQFLEEQFGAPLPGTDAKAA